jgi:1,4-dihydroxy-2-naphthoate octaprenyltransferase
LSPWLLAFRPKTLTTAIAPVLSATALAKAATGKFSFQVVAFSLFGALFIQIGTNLINDAIDFKKGADTSERVGPKRVTQAGLLTPKQVMAGGFVCFAIATAFGIPLVLRGGWPIVVIGALSLLAGYCYTGGPRPLAYNGLGDLFVIIFFGLIAVGGTFFLHTHYLSFELIILGLQIGMLATALIAINNLRDVTQDRQANKRTLAVRLGNKFAKGEIAAMLVLPFVMNGFWLDRYGWAVTLLPLLLIPFAIVLVKKLYKTAPGPAYNGFLARAALIQFLFGILYSIGLFLE